MDFHRARAGYRLERVHVSEQEYRQVDKPGPADSNRGVRFAWDWQPLGPRRFEVVIEVTCDPLEAAPEYARVRVFGIFEAGADVPSVSFADFLKGNAPAILFPYAREVISTMTGRGPYGAFHLDPLNVRALTQDFRIEETAGAKLLLENPAIAESFELDYRNASVTTQENQADNL